MTGKITTWIDGLNKKQKDLGNALFLIILGEGIVIGFVLREVINILGP